MPEDAQPALDLGVAVAAISELTKSLDRSVAFNPQQLNAGLSDLLSGSPREANLLAVVARSGFVRQIAEQVKKNGYTRVQHRLTAAQLVREYALQPSAAMWAVGAWYEGLASTYGDPVEGLVIDSVDSPSDLTADAQNTGKARQRTAWLVALCCLVVAIAAVAALVGVVLNVMPPRQANSQTTPSLGTSSQLAPALSRWLSAGSEGPVRLTVSSYYIFSGPVINSSPLDRTVVLARISVLNQTGAQIDLSAVAQQLVVISKISAMPGFAETSVPAPRTEVYSVRSGPVYGYPVAPGSWDVTVAAGNSYQLGWQGSTLPANTSFSGSSATVNGAQFILPDPSNSSSSGIDVANSDVIGLGLLDPNGGLLGFAPANEWGLNSESAVASATR